MKKFIGQSLYCGTLKCFTPSSDAIRMVFRWGHSRSRASPFYFKIKTRGFTWKLLTCMKFRPFKNARHEIARVRGRGSEISPSLLHSRSLALALSHSRASHFLKPVNFIHVWSFHVKNSKCIYHVSLVISFIGNKICTFWFLVVSESVLHCYKW